MKRIISFVFKEIFVTLKQIIAFISFNPFKNFQGFFVGFLLFVVIFFVVSFLFVSF